MQANSAKPSWEIISSAVVPVFSYPRVPITAGVTIFPEEKHCDEAIEPFFVDVFVYARSKMKLSKKSRTKTDNSVSNKEVNKNVKRTI